MEEKLKNSIKSQQKKSKKKKGMNRGNHEIEPVTSGGCCSCLFGAPKTKNHKKTENRRDELSNHNTSESTDINKT